MYSSNPEQYIYSACIGTTTLVYLQWHISLYTGTVHVLSRVAGIHPLVWPPTRDVGRCPQGSRTSRCVFFHNICNLSTCFALYCTADYFLHRPCNMDHIRTFLSKYYTQGCLVTDSWINVMRPYQGICKPRMPGSGCFFVSAKEIITLCGIHLQKRAFSPTFLPHPGQNRFLQKIILPGDLGYILV